MNIFTGILRSALVALLLTLPGCELIGLQDDEESGYSLTATARSATTLQLQWDAIPGATRYTVDYFSTFTTCEFPPEHNNVQEVTGTSVLLTGLTPATRYQIHVHDLPDYKESTNLILVATLAAGAGTQPVAGTDYTICD